jgi:hypothetical protein
MNSTARSYRAIVAALAMALTTLGIQNASAQAQRQIVTQTPPADEACPQCARPYAEAAPTPPAGFNPLTASDAQIDFYGLPPRPDARKSAGAYAVWEMTVTSTTRRIVPQLRATRIANGPAQIVSRSARQNNGPSGAKSNNWSGYTVSDSANVFATNKAYVYGSFVVPVAQQAYGTCSSTWRYSSSWVGIDGWGSSDVLQAGIEADAQCAGGTTTAFYSAWYEWYPNNETQIQNFPIHPGDLIYVYVWNTSRTKGHYYLADVTANTSTSLAFSAPSGTTLTGNSVEWIVERPGENGTLSQLANYTSVPWYYCHALVPGHAAYSPSAPQDGTSWSLTMQDAKKNISYADTSPDGALSYINPSGASSYYAGTALWFFDEGKAR